MQNKNKTTVSVKEWLEDKLVCPYDQSKLHREEGGYRCSSNNEHFFNICRQIPRFVVNDDYVDSFSYEWNLHRKTQLDSFTNTENSQNQFIEKTGFNHKLLKDKLVLDAGVGSGRYTDVMLKFGANVVGIDLSYSVDAAWKNFNTHSNFSLLQADIMQLPFKKEIFDYIVSIGVLHHTPDTRRYFELLLPYLKPGGKIAIWVYPDTSSYKTRKQWIPFTSRIPKQLFYEWCRWFVPNAQALKIKWLKEYIETVFPYSDQGMGIENDILDTFDGYSPKYHGIHSPFEVKQWFLDAGLINITYPSNNYTCVQGTKPL